MQLKIMMLLSSEKNKASCECAETILQEIAGAFEHKLSVLYEKIGSLSLSSYNSSLTEETIAACEKYSAVLLDDGNAEGTNELYDALKTDLVARYCGVPQSLCGRHERGFSLWIARVHSLNEETLERGIPAAFSCAKGLEMDTLSHVSPHGKFSESWNRLFTKESEKYPSFHFHPYESTDAIKKIIEIPSQVGFLIAPPYAGSIFQAAAETLNPAAFMMHDLALAEKTNVFSPAAPKEILSRNPLSYFLAVSDLLRYSFKLDKEADCLEAAVKNVLEAGWRTPDMVSYRNEMIIDGHDLTDLICEQIELAGQLMGNQKENELNSGFHLQA